jgi:hypothetical protein
MLPPRNPALLATAAALACWLATPAAAGSCPQRISPSFGESVETVAARCGVNVEALKSRNPGMSDGRLDVGVSIEVPRPPLPSPQIEIGGNRGVVAPAQRIVVPRL